MEDFPILQSFIERRYTKIQKSKESYCMLTLTETGLGLSDYLGPQLISPAIWAAMKKWEEAQAYGFVPRKSEKL